MMTARFILSYVIANKEAKKLLSAIIRRLIYNFFFCNGDLVYVATQRRFLKIKRLAHCKHGIKTMLDFIDAALTISNTEKKRLKLIFTECLVEKHAPKVIFSHHSHNNELFESLAKKNINIYHFKAADLPGRITIDKSGFSGWSSLAEKDVDDLKTIPNINQDEIESFYKASRHEIITGNLSKYKQIESHPSSQLLPEKYVFIALQVEDDMVQENAYIPMLEMLDIVAERFDNTEYKVVVKRHPKCKSQNVEKKLLQISIKHKCVSVTKRSIHEILKNASALFTVNSGVGSEAMIYNIPIYIFGSADYAPVCHKVKSKNELIELTDPIRSKCSFNDLIYFYYYYRNTYQVSTSTDLKRRIKNYITY